MDERGVKGNGVLRLGEKAEEGELEAGRRTRRVTFGIRLCSIKKEEPEREEREISPPEMGNHAKVYGEGELRHMGRCGVGRGERCATVDAGV